ncbi:hypothetical protein GBA52_009329 [Prunus armeniaca]|nr:hypothetical protein GBA52_009329 [Prunus armeniaca]
MVKRLKRGVLVGKVGGLCSMPPPIWRLDEFYYQQNNNNKPSSEFLPQHFGISSSFGIRR